MTRSFWKTAYYLVQLIICLLLIMERVQPTFLPSVYCGHDLRAVRLLPKQRRLRMRAQPRSRALSWRRLLFLLG